MVGSMTCSTTEAAAGEAAPSKVSEPPAFWSRKYAPVGSFAAPTSSERGLWGRKRSNERDKNKNADAEDDDVERRKAHDARVDVGLWLLC